MAVDMFFKIGDIKGGAQDDKHKGEIDVLAWSWGMSQSGTTHLGGGGGAGKVSVQDMSFTKYVDRSTPNLILFCCNGKHIPQAKLIVRKAGEFPVDYIVITMSDLIITSVSTGGSGGEDLLTENVTLNFKTVKFEYQPQKDDGSADGPPLPTGWDMAANIQL
jgi:type VI secretion system secreted protein Hcp